MIGEFFANALMDVVVTVFFLAAVVLVSAAMRPPRPPRGPYV